MPEGQAYQGADMQNWGGEAHKISNVCYKDKFLTITRLHLTFFGEQNIQPRALQETRLSNHTSLRDAGTYSLCF